MSAQRIPAWKRLGLKLKYANDNAEALDSGPTSTVKDGKRKKDWELNGSDDHHRQLKRSKVDVKASKGKLSRAQGHSEATDNTVPKHKKSVSFTKDTKVEDGDGAQTTHSSTPDSSESTQQTTNKPKRDGLADKQVSDSLMPNKTKKLKRPKSNATRTVPATPRKATAALNYLQQFQDDRPAWKFNKNHETWLLKNTLSTASISSVYNYPLAYYVAQLKSKGARQRLAEQSQKALTDLPSSAPASNDIHSGGRSRLLHALNTGPRDLDAAEAEWVESIDRATLILWSLDEFSSNSNLEGVANAKPILRTKKNKSRTSRIDVDLLSSSDSESDSSSSEPVSQHRESTQQSTRDKKLPLRDRTTGDASTESTSESLTSGTSSDSASTSDSDSE